MQYRKPATSPLASKVSGPSTVSYALAQYLLQHVELGRARPPGGLGEDLDRSVGGEREPLGVVALGREPPHRLGRRGQLARVGPEAHQRALTARAGEVPVFLVHRGRV